MFLGVHPFRATKGEALSVYINNTVDSGGGNFSKWNNTYLSIEVSKDGNAFQVLEGEHDGVTNGLRKITLTADEMNADTVIIKIDSTSGTNYGEDKFYVIYTTHSKPTSASYSPAVLTAIMKAVNAGYEISDVALDEDGYNYYGLTSDNNAWWLIIREKTSNFDVKYAMKHKKKQTYSDGWSNRDSLSYGSSFRVK